MQLADRSGIKCDHCGLECRTEFIYYSFDFRHVDIYNGHIPSLQQILHLKVAKSLDWCSLCYDDIKKTVVESNAKLTGKQSKTRVCELSMVSLPKELYYVTVAHVSVKTNNDASCVNCKTQAKSEAAPCTKCGGMKYRRSASVNANPRVLEFNISAEVYGKMLDKVRSDSGWTTRT